MSATSVNSSGIVKIPDHQNPKKDVAVASKDHFTTFASEEKDVSWTYLEITTKNIDTPKNESKMCVIA